MKGEEYAKMARGEMVRFMAGRSIEEPEEIKEFAWSGYHFNEELSRADKYVFVREGKLRKRLMCD